MMDVVQFDCFLAQSFAKNKNFAHSAAFRFTYFNSSIVLVHGRNQEETQATLKDIYGALYRLSDTYGEINSKKNLNIVHQWAFLIQTCLLSRQIYKKIKKASLFRAFMQIVPWKVTPHANFQQPSIAKLYGPIVPDDHYKGNIRRNNYCESFSDDKA